MQENPCSLHFWSTNTMIYCLNAVYQLSHYFFRCLIEFPSQGDPDPESRPRAHVRSACTYTRRQNAYYYYYPPDCCCCRTVGSFRGLPAGLLMGNTCTDGLQRAMDATVCLHGIWHLICRVYECSQRKDYNSFINFIIQIM